MREALAASPLRDAYQRGRRAWPEIPLSEPLFAAALSRHLAGEATPTRLHTDDLYLATACAAGIAPALAAFERHHVSTIGSTVGRFNPSPDFLAEVAQRLRMRLLIGDSGGQPRIASYAGRGPLRSWVHICAARLAIALARRTVWRSSECPAELDVRLIDSGDPELDCIRERYREDFQQAFRQGLNTLTPRQRNALRLRYLDGLNIDGIGEVYRVHRTTAARWIAEAKQRIADTTRCALAQRLRLSASRIDSLVRLLQSNLELSASLLVSSS
jgi:RNA polymerase sigma-70 factor (ECF subfamily)